MRTSQTIQSGVIQLILANRKAGPELLAELKRMKLGDLKQKAREMGCDQSAVDDADDTADPKQAVIELILAKTRTQADPKLLAELKWMRLGALKLRAREIGCDNRAVDDADDSEDPKEAVIDLILSKTNRKDSVALIKPKQTSSLAFPAPAAPSLEHMAGETVIVKGSLVEVHGLTEDSELNGQRGACNGQEEDGRIRVKFAGSPIRALPSEAIVLIRDGSMFSPMPQRFPVPASSVGNIPRRRILAYGDSLTAGYYNSGVLFWPYAAALAQGLLLAFATDVWVCGLSGLSAEQMVDAVEKPEVTDYAKRIGKGLGHILIELGPFDLVLIMAGTNDLASSTPVTEVAEHIFKLHNACHRKNMRTAALSVPPNESSERDGSYRRSWEALNNSIEAWANGEVRERVHFVDTNMIVPFEKGSKLWESDGLHLTEAGSRTLGEGLALQVAPLLRLGSPWT